MNDISFETSADLPNRAVFHWQDPIAVGSSHHFLAIEGDVTTGEVDFQSIVPRLVAHVLVSKMPNAGLDELWSSLTRMYEFYATKDDMVALPRRERVQGVIKRTYDRPEIELVDE